MPRIAFTWWLPALLLAALAGCHAALPAAGSGAAPGRPFEPEPKVAAQDARVPEAPADFVLPVHPSRILEVEGDTALTGTVTGTPSLVPDLAGQGHRLNDVLVYFTSPDELYYAARTTESNALTLVTARTDGAGNFATAAVFPKGHPVVVNVLLARNRRLVGFGLAGQMHAGVSPGSTYAFEFLRDQAAARKQNLATHLDDAAVRSTLVAQGARADELIRAGKLPPPTETAPDGDLIIGNGAAMASRYIAHALGEDQVAAQAWRGVFGGLYALTTLAGNFHLRDFEPDGPARAVAESLHGPSAVAADPTRKDLVFIAERDGWHVKAVTLGGELTLVAGRTLGVDPSIAFPVVAPDKAIVSKTFQLALVHEIKADHLGNMALTFRSSIYPLHLVGFLCRASGTYYGRKMDAGTFYRLTAPDGLEGYNKRNPDGSLKLDAPLDPVTKLPTARFRDPHGLAFDDKGNLFVADRRHNRIRRIDRFTGTVDTVLGDGWPFLQPTATGGFTWGDEDDGISGSTTRLSAAEAGATGSKTIVVTDLGRLRDQPAGSGSGLKASFNRPLHLAWRKVGGQQELYVYDSYNNVVRRATVADGDSFQNAAVETVAGTVVDYPGRSYPVKIGVKGYEDGPVASAKFSFAHYDPMDRFGAQVVFGGMALDAEQGLLYVTDTNNRAIRAIDLAGKQVTTVARHGPDFVAGDSKRSLQSESLGGLAVLADHSLVFADTNNHVIRRLHLQFGL